MINAIIAGSLNHRFMVLLAVVVLATAGFW